MGDESGTTETGQEASTTEDACNESMIFEHAAGKSAVTTAVDKDPAVMAIRLWCEYVEKNLPDDLIGPWRECGESTDVKELKAEADKGNIQIKEGTDVKNVTSLITMFLKAMSPDPLISSEEADELIEANGDIEKIDQVVLGMSPCRSAILGILVLHWQRVAKDRGGNRKNKMTPNAIAKAMMLTIVDDKKELQRISIKILQIEHPLCALIEHVDPSGLWPKFSTATQFPELAEVPSRRTTSSPAVALPQRKKLPSNPIATGKPGPKTAKDPGCCILQ